MNGATIEDYSIELSQTLNVPKPSFVQVGSYVLLRLLLVHDFVLLVYRFCKKTPCL